MEITLGEDGSVTKYEKGEVQMAPETESENLKLSKS